MAEPIYASIKTGSVTFIPQNPSSVPLGCIYMDKTSSNVLTTKTTGGTDQPVGTTSSSDIFIKLKTNTSGVSIPANTRVSLKSDGGICLSDSDDPNARQSIGMALESIAPAATGKVLLDGPNAVGAVAGMGFTPGRSILLSRTPGMLTADLSIFDPAQDVIMKVGIADCSTGTALGTASDLIMVTEVISTPSGV